MPETSEREPPAARLVLIILLQLAIAGGAGAALWQTHESPAPEIAARRVEMLRPLIERLVAGREGDAALAALGERVCGMAGALSFTAYTALVRGAEQALKDGEVLEVEASRWSELARLIVEAGGAPAWSEREGLLDRARRIAAKPEAGR